MASRPTELNNNIIRGTPDGARGRGRYPTYMLAALLLAAFVAFAVTTYVSLKRELTQAAMVQSAALSRLAASTLSERIERAADVTVSLATRVRFAELVSAGDWARAGAILKSVPERFAHVRRLVVTDVHGTLRFDEPALAGVRGQNFAHRDWYRGVSDDWQTYVSPLYSRTAAPQNDVIAVATPVLERRNRDEAGLQVAHHELDSFFDWS
jgi:hypothetical protein